MANTLKNCPVCGAEMAANAKACPKCGAKNKKPVYKKWWFWVIIVLVVSGIIGGATSEPKKVGEVPQSSGENVTTSNTSGTVEERFNIGDKVELNDIVVTMTGIKESSGSQFNTPSDGNIFVLCSFVIENNSDKELSVSSMLCFDAYCDDYACNYSLTAQLESDENQLDGTVASGKKMSGTIGYEVTKDWKELEVHFTPDFWTGRDIVFVATK